MKLKLSESRPDRPEHALEDGPECSLRHVAWMIWDRCIAIRHRIEPDLMAPGGLTVKFKAARS